MYQLKCAVSVRMSDAENKELLSALKEHGYFTYEVAAMKTGSADKNLDEVFVRSVLNSFYIQVDSALQERA